MTINTVRARHYLKNFKLAELFIEELGWDRHAAELHIPVDGHTYALRAVAEKRGAQVFVCEPGPDGKVPDRALRLKIERQLTKSAYEHLVVFTDEPQSVQIWQWVARQPGQPTAYREHHYHPRSQDGEALVQKFASIAFSLSDEEELTLTGVTVRLRDAFDRDRVTKRFYDRFQKEHQAFLKFIKGIGEKTDRSWYASLMLNRLMFVYFIQKKGFLDDDRAYLRNRMKKVQASRGKGKFLSFYRYFLLRLFHEGFSKQPPQRAPDLDALIGKVPYLNGGIFEPHELERKYEEAEIPDEAFEKIFTFFDQYEWHLDTRPLAKDTEINPDVLGYIFEKYINQKQMGAYYTKEDITEYISKNTIIPYLFDAAQKKCAVAFEPDSAVWRLLAEDPDRYLYEPVKRGVVDGQGNEVPETALPDFVQVGMKDPKARMFDRRYNLGEADLTDADGHKLTLPTETWREYVSRRQRCLELREKLAAGEVHHINDLITYNLDIRQFAEDVIATSEGPELLRAFWRAIQTVTVLDPTCGSGAFLFAALNILDPLYEACLERMQAFLEDLAHSGERHRPEKFSDFRKTLEDVDRHPNHRYFILKSIVVNNLYGVDIMEEAVEICKLRLFLKLVAQVDSVRRIEPLPDIDFNIRAGNTLVGFVTVDEVRKAASLELSGQGRLVFGETDKAIRKIEEDAEIVERAFQKFHEMQTQQGVEAREFAEAKSVLREQLQQLANQLNKYLAKEHLVDPNRLENYQRWRATHQPFHWVTEFFGIIGRGGFDVIIGNPPYLETKQVDYETTGYASQDTRAVHAMCMERSLKLLHRKSCMSMIVPLALPSTKRMQIVQELLEEGRDAWYSNFSWRPGKLFDTVNRALTIFVITPVSSGCTFSTNYQKWTSNDRDGLFERLRYIEVPRDRPDFWIPKLGDPLESSILAKCLSEKAKTSSFTGKTNFQIYYRTDGGLYWKVFTDFPPAFVLNGKSGHSSRETRFTVSKKEWIRPIIAALSSDIFWWWYTVTSNVRHLNPYDVQNFHLPMAAISDMKIVELGGRYLDDINKNSTMLVREQKQTGTTETQSFKIQKSKPILDEIDSALARHYGFTAEELDFIVNYDIKYRIGPGNEESELMGKHLST